MVTEDDIKNALKSVKYPGYSRDIVSFGLVKQITATNGAVSVSLQVTANNPEVAQQIKSESERVLRALPGVNKVYVQVNQPNAPQPAAPQSPWAQQNKVPGIHRIVAIASGKGGVGKSTLSVNLSCALQHLGAKVGLLLDGDQPVIWRGPMIVKTIQQFITAVEWGELDFLLVDLPPGTGDAQLTLCQTVPLDGGVIVTTPQEASLG